MNGSLSQGYKLSISNGKYFSMPDGYVIGGMQTVFETRRARLKTLVEKHGTIAGLNRALGWEETNGRLYQIHNRSIRSDRGTPYEMGDPTAREIELTLGLEIGYMDTPPNLGEDEADPIIANLLAIARQLKEAHRDNELVHLLQIGNTFIEPATKRSNGA